MFGNNKYIGKLLRQSLPSLPADFVKTQIVGRFKAIPPTILIWNVSYKCDSKCVMCNSWKLPYHDDLTTEEYRKVFSSELFRSIEYVGITGGEPTLRKDMVEIVRIMSDNMPRLRKVTLNTNGFVVKRVVPVLDQIIDVADERGFLFGTRVSLDGVGEAHEKIRRVWNAFDRSMETVRAMQEIQKRKFFNFGVSFTFTGQNIEDGEKLYEFCKKENLNVVFAIARYSELAFGNIDISRFDGAQAGRFPAFDRVLPQTSRRIFVYGWGCSSLSSLRQDVPERNAPSDALSLHGSRRLVESERGFFILREQPSHWQCPDGRSHRLLLRPNPPCRTP